MVKLWNLKTVPSIISIDKGFFVVKFFAIEDRSKAILSGPNFINGSFLSLQPWKPRFNPAIALKTAMSPVWIKLDDLPLEFFNPLILLKMGDAIGTFLGTDDFTHNLVKAGFARICVLLDLTQNLPTEVTVDGFTQPLSFEGNLGFCISCGIIGHSTSSCRLYHTVSMPLIENPVSHSPNTPSSAQNNVTRPENMSWITVRKKKRPMVKDKSGVPDSTPAIPPISENGGMLFEF